MTTKNIYLYRFSLQEELCLDNFERGQVSRILRETTTLA